MEQVKYYTNKSNANCSGVKQFGKDNYLIETTQLGFKVIELLQSSTVAESIKADKIANNAMSDIPRESTVERPCFVVWEIADNMPGARRKDVVAACVAKGVAYYTARTQYQLWNQCKKEMAARAEAK